MSRKIFEFMKKVEYSLELRLAAEKFLVKMFELDTPEPSDMMISAAMYCITNTPWVADNKDPENGGNDASNGDESTGENDDGSEGTGF